MARLPDVEALPQGQMRGDVVTTLIGCLAVVVLIAGYAASVVYRAHDDPYHPYDDAEDL
jgi:hypothetical protein